MCSLGFIASVITLTLAIFGRNADSAVMIYGSGDVSVAENKDYNCKVFPFNPAFNSNNVRVQLSLRSTNYQAAVTWVEEVTSTGFSGCVATSGRIDGSRTVALLWIAYQTISNGAYEKKLSIPLWTTGTKCVFDDFATNVLVFTNTSVPNGWKVPLANEVYFANTRNPSSDYKYSYCKTVDFPQKFYEVPSLITTPKHKKVDIDADNMAVSEWTESVTTLQFKVCLKDIQRFNAPNHDPITLSYMATGYYHPCNGKTCLFYGDCTATSSTTSKCICSPCTTDESAPLCDNKDITHKNKCEYNYKACLAQEEPGIKHYGGCKPFILQRGRVALRLNSIDVRCRTVNFKNGTFESSRGNVRIQTTINYFNYSGNFTHDVAVTWVENVDGIKSFKVCALKAGRAERLTPDDGLTFIDFIAFQEAPKDSAAGQIVLSNWWDGTQCKEVSFSDNWMVYDTLPSNLLAEKSIVDFKNDALPLPGDYNAYCQDVSFQKSYSSTPTVIVTASHLNPKAGYTNRLLPDSNSIASWIEEITTTKYKVCIKEIHNQNGYDPVKVAVLAIEPFVFSVNDAFYSLEISVLSTGA
ncbi:hypothetical protein OS493_006361 [Desmophyllum pertusum]|uniref:Kazal-like domain-containing protein n=1 Tax=Desmophyllum pertusum TaxID=174260 RepID=A0A9X0DCW0_9CNID|nr:hypothetical protein OS493_006361 [Desmophyllum pertusum]